MDINCPACQGKINPTDYKQPETLRKFVSGTFKIISSRRNGLCKRHQSQIASTIKRARFMALLPYTRNQVHRK